MEQVQNKSQGHFWAHMGLVLVALIWGSSITVTQNVVNAYPPQWILAVRYTIASLVLGVIFWRRIKNFTVETLKASFVIACFLFLGTSLQTLAVRYSTPGRITFLSASYCVMIPFVAWLWLRERPKVKHLWAALFCLIGIYFVSHANQASSIAYTPQQFVIGDTLSIASGLVYACHIVSVSKYTKDHDMIQLTVFPFIFAAMMSWLSSWFLEDTSHLTFDKSGILQLVYLALFCSALALLLQTNAQKHANPTLVGLLLSLESIFGVIIPVVMGIESLNSMILIGFAFIFTAIVIAESSPALLAYVPIIRHLPLATASGATSESE